MAYRIRTLYALFAVSGFCGLIYESIWGQYLKLFLGHAAYAQTVVLIVFIGGLALGSWVAGAFALRLSRPLLAYAAAELLVGLAALTFHWVFVHATDWAYAHLLPAACSAEHWCWVQWIYAGLLIFPQSVLLGTTFPLMSGGILRLDAHAAGGKLSLLYFLNSIGAAAGVLTSGYLLIPAIGLPGALTTAGIMNVVLALVVYFVDKNTSPAPAVRLESDSAPPQSALPGFVATMLAVAMLTGLSSFIYEVAWIRSLSLVLGGSTHAFELMLAAFILGLALGGLWIRGRIDSIGDILRFLGVVQVVMGLLALLTLPTYDATFQLMSWLLRGLRQSESGWVLFNVSSSFICLLVMLPATFMAGMTLPLISYALLRSRLAEKSIGHVYAANTLGGIVGVAIAVHFALPVLGLKGALVLGGAIDAALGVWLLWRAPLAGLWMRRSWSALAVAGVLAGALLFHLDPLKLASGVFNFGRPRLVNAEVVYHADGRTATVTVVRSATNHVSIATNGKTDGGINHGVQPSLDEYTMTMLASMPLAHRPDARDVAVIGYGTGMSTTVLLGSPRVQRVDTIEIEPDMPRGAQAFRFFTEPAYSDPRSRVIIDDAKSYFARSTRRYDVILSEPSNPWVSGVASLFTREFYARVSGKLNDGGILVQWLHTYSFSDALLASIIKAMRESFPAFVIYAANSGDLVVVASPSGKVPPLDPAVMHLGRIPEYLGRIEVRRIEDLEIRRVADQDSVKALFSTIDVAPNSDYFPIVDSGAARARFMNEIAFGIHDVGNAPWPILEMTARSPLAPEAPLSVPKWYSDRRTETAVRAQVAFGFLTGAAIPDAEAREQLGDSYRAFATFRDRFIACGSDFPATDLWDVLEVVATHESVFLPPAESAQLWERVRRSSCYAKLPDRVRGWLAVFDALGRRDAAESARTALAALEGAKGEAQQSYFYGAAMTGLIAAGRMDEARKTYDRHHAALPETVKLRGWFRWIEGRVLGAAKPGAAAAGAARVAGVH